MTQIVLIRHGESTWNQQGLYTGWTDVELTELGIEQARMAGRALRDAGWRFDRAFCSMLQRSEATLLLALKELDQSDIPIVRTWRLNERHYGAMQGLAKEQCGDIFGSENARAAARDYHAMPPPLPLGDPRDSALDPRYAHLDASLIPRSESLCQAGERIAAFWDGEASSALLRGERVLISAHGNVLRSLIKRLENIPDDQVAELDLPNGLPFVYELNDQLLPLSRCFIPLGS